MKSVYVNEYKGIKIGDRVNIENIPTEVWETKRYGFNFLVKGIRIFGCLVIIWAVKDEHSWSTNEHGPSKSHWDGLNSGHRNVSGFIFKDVNGNVLSEPKK